MNDSSSNDGSVETLASSATTIDLPSRNTAPNRSSATGSDSTRRNPIVDFARACDSTYHPSRPQEVAAGLVHDALAAGEARFIMNMPPRHGKSRLVAVETALWWMVHHPKSEVVIASYGLDLAERHARQAKQQAQSAACAAITPLAADRRSASDWALGNGSTCRAVGVGGSLTGHGADLMILDDLHKDAAEANSAHHRDTVWDWLRTVALTRLSPTASVVLIGTRWHQDDVTGRLLAGQAGLWTHVNLPAVARANDPVCRLEGEALWPERFPLPALGRIQRQVSSYHWSALYEGSPIADAGNHVQIDRFQLVAADQVPPLQQRVRFWDLAVTGRTSGDYTVGALCGRDRQDNLWILDIVRGRWEWTEARARICEQAHRDRCQTGIESVGPQKGLVQNLREVFPRTFALTEHRPEQDKLTRALPWFTRVNSGQAYLVQAPWNTAFLDECQSFPLGAHDDQIDAVSGAAALLSAPRRLVLPFATSREEISRRIAERRRRYLIL